MIFQTKSMSINFKEKKVQIGTIDTENKIFEITTCTKIANLVDSIKKIGLINYPILIRNNKSFIVVSGFRRIAACRSIGWLYITARILDSDTDHPTCIKIAIAENTMQRPLNLVEQAKSLNLLSNHVDTDKHLIQVASEFGLPDNHVLINKIKQICFLDPLIQKCILNEIISLSVALLLSKIEPDAAIEFAVVFEQLKLSLSKQREIISLVEEIAIREGTGMINVLRNDFLKETLSDNDFDRNKKAQRIRYYLKRRRFPEIIKAEKEFAQHVKALKLESGMKLVPPKNFEGGLFTLSISFKNIIELNKSRELIDKIIQNQALNKILR